MNQKHLEQYWNNLGIMSSMELDAIQNKKIMIVGLGGLGGHVADSLVRLGVSRIMLVDFDVFEVSNLNRQLYSTHENIGEYKVNRKNSRLTPR
jgi:tRNA A37 threonylcarbamoyladenosine dehydratase